MFVLSCEIRFSAGDFFVWTGRRRHAPATDTMKSHVIVSPPLLCQAINTSLFPDRFYVALPELYSHSTDCVHESTRARAQVTMLFSWFI